MRNCWSAWPALEPSSRRYHNWTLFVRPNLRFAPEAPSRSRPIAQWLDLVVGRYNNPEIDKLLLEARSAPDEAIDIRETMALASHGPEN
jgi:hypothetical protein